MDKKITEMDKNELTYNQNGYNIKLKTRLKNKGEITIAIFRKVHTDLWKDPKVIEELTPEVKLLFLYILTNPNTTQIGIYKITKKQIAFEIGYSQEAVNSLMDLLENKYKLIRYNQETRELGVKNWGRYNLDRGGKPMVDCITKELKEVKDKTLINYVSENIKKQEIKEIFNLYIENYDTYHESLDVSIQTSIQEKDKEKEKEEDKEDIKKQKLNNKYKKGNENAEHTRKHTKDECSDFFKEKDESIYKKPTDEQLRKVRELLTK